MPPRTASSFTDPRSRTLARSSSSAILSTPAASRGPDPGDPLPALGLLLFALTSAHGAPDPAGDLVAELLDRARDGSLDAGWIEAHVRPGAQPWSRSTREAWTRALDAGSPLRRALARAGGIVHVARGQGATRVIVESVPPLAIVVDEAGHELIRAIAPTSCTTCDERYRYVADLLDDVRRRGAVYPRLRPGLELDVGEVVGSDKQFDPSWSASLDGYLTSDPAVREALSSAIVLGHEGDVVRLRYPDGREDTWRIGWTDDGLSGRIAYDALAPDSPLRLEGDAVLPWRPDGYESSHDDVAWRPETRGGAEGEERQLGRAAAAAILDARDPRGDTVLVLALEPDQGVTSLFRVEPDSGEVLERHAGPSLPHDVAIASGAYAGRALLALDPVGHKAAFTLPTGLFVVDLQTDQATHVEAAEVSLVTFGGAGEWIAGTTDGRLLVGGEAIALPTAARPIAAWAQDGRVEVVDAQGGVTRLRADGTVDERVTACDGDAIAAARRPRDGTWLVACGPTSASSHALVWPLHGGVQAFAGEGATAGACAWSPDGSHYVVPAPSGGSELWDDHRDRAEVRFGRTPLRNVAFTADGDDLLGTTRDGGVSWWHVPTLRKLHWIVAAEHDE